MGRGQTLGEYLLLLCERHNLSMRRASERAGLDPTTIAQIVRRGKTSTPRPDTLRLIADALGGNYRYMMQLAGHLPPAPSTPLTAIPRLQEFVTRLADLPRREQELIMATALMLLDLTEGDDDDEDTPAPADVLPGAAEDEPDTD